MRKIKFVLLFFIAIGCGSVVQAQMNQSICKAIFEESNSNTISALSIYDSGVLISTIDVKSREIHFEDNFLKVYYKKRGEILNKFFIPYDQIKTIRSSREAIIVML